MNLLKVIRKLKIRRGGYKIASIINQIGIVGSGIALLVLTPITGGTTFCILVGVIVGCSIEYYWGNSQINYLDVEIPKLEVLQMNQN